MKSQAMTALLTAILLTSFSFASADLVDRVRVVVPPQSGPTVNNIASLLARQITTRCDAEVITSGEAELTINLAIEPGIGDEGFKIEGDTDRAIRIVGNDERGLLFGVGKFLRVSRYDRGGFTPGTWRGTSIPKCPVRAIYLATHYRNFYEAASPEEVGQYIESLALWGYNTVIIHYPTWQFTGISDPAAREWLERSKKLFRGTKDLGLSVGLIQASADGYKGTPVELLKTPVPGHRRGNFGIGLCPSKPKARALLKQTYGDLLDEFSETGLDYFVFWPYDEGGCACKECWPWGARGFVSISKDLAAQVRSRFPKCKLVVSTWCFENENDANPDGEWVGLAQELSRDKTWADYLMADGHNNYFPKYLLTEGVPGNLPLINFPEISMFDQSPWGGYGTNPAPAHFEELWGRIKHLAAGGAPYSEGIYEDLNKAICAGFYWDPDRKAEDIVREYVSFEFTPDAADDLVEVARIFERNHNRASIQENALRAFELVRRADALMTPQARKSWRWRIFYLRALIDKELFESKGKMEGEVLKKAFEELTEIYHAHECRFRPPQLN